MKKFNLLISLIFIAVNLPGQNQYLTNASLEGDNSTKTLTGWSTCKNDGVNNNNFNDPDFLEFYTDEIYQDTLFNKDGETMCLLRARSEHYSNPNKDSTYEHISSELIHRLIPDSLYTLSIWMVNLGKMHISDAFDTNISYPMRFQVFGANEYCKAESNNKLLDTLVSNKEWQLYNLDFTPSNDFTHIYFRVFWDNKITAELDGKYNGVIFIDSASLYRKCRENILLPDTVYFKTSPPLQLIAPNGIYYTWEPSEYLSETTRQKTILNGYTPDVKVTVLGKDQCPFEKNYHIILSCDTLHQEIETSTPVYYKRYENIYLNASPGENYAWNPTKPLSNYNIQNPVLTDYDSVVNVTITDKYGCDFNEVFNVYINCDSLYLNHRIIHDVQEVAYGQSIILTPEYSGNNYAWSPSEFLNCTNCDQIEFNAYENSNYMVTYTDDFNCTLSESFSVNIEFKIPNVITPGLANEGDGKNDMFLIPGLPEGASIKIFNKTGVLVFEADPYDETNWWTGDNLHGNPVHSGTYWYVLYIPGNVKPTKGFVFVKR